MLKEALRQFPAGRVVMVDEFRTSRVSSADNTPSEAFLDTPPKSFRWLWPVYSEAKRSQVRGSSRNNIRFYDRDVSAALNIRRCAVGPGPHPTELCRWAGRPTMPKPGNTRKYTKKRVFFVSIQYSDTEATCHAGKEQLGAAQPVPQ
ncbi:hypothetical protein HaLaN_31905, partial [Haematococcus lacustris]